MPSHLVVSLTHSCFGSHKNSPPTPAVMLWSVIVGDAAVYLRGDGEVFTSEISKGPQKA